MALKPRIVLTIVSDDGKIEFSTVEGREMPNGEPSPGPTAKQYAIAYQAIRDLLAAPAEPRRKAKRHAAR